MQRLFRFFLYTSLSILCITLGYAQVETLPTTAPEANPPPVTTSSSQQQSTKPATTTQLEKISLTPFPTDLPVAVRQATIPVIQILQEYHFAHEPIDVKKTRAWIKAYMEALDYYHLIFYEADLETFTQQFSGDLTQRTARGDLRPAFQIFYAFKQRLQQRMKWVAERLKKPFDFTQNDTYELDRSKGPWPTDIAQADAIWERRLKFDLLQEKMASKNTSNNNSPNGTKPKETPVQAVSKRYERFQKSAQDYDAEDLMQTYLSALCSLYDPHSQYMSPSTLEDFSINMNLALVGIGAVLSTEDGYCTIREIIPGGPADLDKRLKVNDKIIAVGQGPSGSYVDIVDMKLRNAVKLIRGEKGTTVRLKVIPGDADPSTRKEIALVRDKIELTAQQANAQLVEQKLPDGTVYRVGVIELPSFYGEVGADDKVSPEDRTSTSDVLLLLDYLKEQGIDALVLDLRRNGGGLLDEAVKLTGLFIGRGPVVQVKDQNGVIRVHSSNRRKPAYTGPMIVLTSRNSASASEIVAGALQNYNRALIVGDKSTHGKGTVQAVVELKRFLPPAVLRANKDVKAGAIKLTIQKFYLPNGHSTQNRGVLTDVPLPSLNDYLKIGEADSPHALPWDEIRSSRFRKLTLNPARVVENLRNLSAQRVAQSEVFNMLKEDIERLRARIEGNQISLNEAKRLEEKKVEEERRKQVKELQKKLAASNQTALSYFVIKQGSDKTPHVEPSKEPVNTSLFKRKNDPNDEEDEDQNSYSHDLHLRETLQIMIDWLEALKNTHSTAVVIESLEDEPQEEILHAFEQAETSTTN